MCWSLSVLTVIQAVVVCMQIVGVHVRCHWHWLVGWKLFLHRPEKIPRLFDLVHAKNEKYSSAFYYSLRDTAVAKDLDQAIRVGLQVSLLCIVVPPRCVGNNNRLSDLYTLPPPCNCTQAHMHIHTEAHKHSHTHCYYTQWWLLTFYYILCHIGKNTSSCCHTGW